jgi:hypothetical protein
VDDKIEGGLHFSASHVQLMQKQYAFHRALFRPVADPTEICIKVPGVFACVGAALVGERRARPTSESVVVGRPGVRLNGWSCGTDIFYRLRKAWQ